MARSLRQIGFDSATALLSTYGGRGAELGPWLKDAEINRDKNLRLQFLAGFGMNIDQRVEIYRGILAHRRYPDDLFIGSPERLADIAQRDARPPELGPIPCPAKRRCGRGLGEGPTPTRGNATYPR